MHSTTETTEPLNCCFCLKTCVNIEDLQAHIGSEHFNYHPFTCAYCPEGDGRSKFSTKAAIKRHCASEHGMTRFHIRLWVSDQVENDEKEIEKCLQKCVNNSRRSQPLALALPSQPQRIENQMVEFPSPDDRYTQPVGVTPQPLDISFTTSSSGSNYSNGRLIRPNTTRTSNPRNSVVDRNVDQNVTGEHDDYTDSSGSTSRNRNESGAEVRSVPAVSATAHIIVDERSLNPFRKSLTNPSPPRKRRHDMATPSPINNNNNNNHNNRIKQIAKKSCIQEVDEKDVFNIRRQAFVNSSYNSQLQLTSEQRYEDTDQNRSLTRSQRSLNSSAHFNSSGLSYSGGGGSSSSKLKKQLKCTSCKKLYRNNNYDMRSHINNTHLRLPLYSCAECNKHFFNRRHKAVEHIHEFHRGKQNLLIDNTAIYEPIVAARSKRIVSRGHSIQSISQRQAPVRRQNSCSTPSLVRTRSVGPETRSQNTGNAGSNQKRPTCSQPASSGGIKRFLRSGANTSLPICKEPRVQVA
uniref:C2H2-type domain-containing protein n=1 Tax=Ditylenchus dipsaci TaxID=166011 RepID=A0A915D7M3_9BILA